VPQAQSHSLSAPAISAIARVVLQIGIERHDEPAARGFMPAHSAADWPQLKANRCARDARVGRREFLEDFPGLVPAAIVGDDDS